MTASTSTSVVELAQRTQDESAGLSLWKMALRRLRRDRLSLIAIGIIALLVVLSILAPFIATQLLKVDYSRTSLGETFLPIGSTNHLLGTDDLGRDHLARLLYAGQVSLGIAFVAAFLSLSIGVTVGILAGYYGGWLDDAINWLIATLGSIPTLFLLLIIAAVFSPGPMVLILVLGGLGWLSTARLVRGETLALREREYVISARSIGASNIRIMLQHILPNLLSIVLITLATDIGDLILTESALSFLGLGIQPPTPSWGNMLSNAQTFFTLGPHLVVLPGILISTTVLCLYVIGDGLRDAFDPTARD
ncbi:MAG: ABC transporter permease [Anaerolineae bacterium]|nr:ABC transporter permease [Anaerolineae bacterium]